MSRVTIKQIAKITDGELFSKNPLEILVKSFSIDSRTIEPGQFFIAVKGENFDGHNFVEEAAAKGAAGFIIEGPAGAGLAKKAVHIIQVKNTLKAMGDIASEIRSCAELPVICVIGSNGKTTVKDMLSGMLSSKYKVLASKRSYNNLIGLSLTLFGMNPSCEAVVLELGTNSPGEILNLSRIARPDVVVVTNIGSAHLGAFGSKGKIFEEKISILNSLSSKGAFFFNKDDSLLSAIRSRQYNFLTQCYGRTSGSDFLISRILQKKEGSEFFLGKNKFYVPFPGLHNVYNASAAIASALYMGVQIREIQKALKCVKLPDMRMANARVDKVRFINDSYNASPESFECALNVLQENQKGFLKGVVTGGMLELGPKTKEFHRKIGQSIAARGINFLIVVGDLAKDIASGALRKGMSKKQVFYADSHMDAARKIQNLEEGREKVVLLKGSRETRMEEVLKCFTMFYTR
ncbi:MAG: UDP-N-acetylmuramoyl-tripeptide--D-alanyl-D-alanine ligase [Candidatus Omnitrophota bacterium]